MPRNRNRPRRPEHDDLVLPDIAATPLAPPPPDLLELAGRTARHDDRLHDLERRLASIEHTCSDVRSAHDQQQLATDARERIVREAEERRAEREWIQDENARDPVLVVMRNPDGAYGRDAAIRRSSACERLGILDGITVRRYVVRDSEWRRLLAHERQLRDLIADGHLVVHRATVWHDIADLIGAGVSGALL